MTDPVLKALQEIVPVTRGQVEMRGEGEGGGRMLRWIESGTGTPTVVLIAGRNDTALSWGPVLAALAGRVRAVAYDRAGLGDSDPDLKTPSTERTVADLSRLVNVVSTGPCLVAGHSYGGLLGLLLAASRPDQLAGLVLVDPVVPGLLDWMPRPVRRAYGAAARARPIALYAAGRLQSATRRRAESVARVFSDDPRIQALVTDAYLASADWPHVLAGYREGRGIAASEPAIRRSLPAPAAPDLSAPAAPDLPAPAAPDLAAPAVPDLAAPAAPDLPAPAAPDLAAPDLLAVGGGAQAAPLIAGLPMVVLSATEGRPAWLRRRWTALQAGLAAERGARHVVATGSGHAVPLDRPALVAEAILGCARTVRPR
jgi:pimeloyl-ACP methyl ester carboxylesterase